MSLYARAVRARAWVAHPLSERLATARRDLQAVLATLRGERRSAPKLFAAPARTRRLVVAEVVRETPDAVTLVFAPSDAVATWRAGEFLTLGVRLPDGAMHRRAYSICRPPPRAGAPASPAVTVKRVAGGRVSGWLVDHAAPGLALDVQGPSGRFVFEPRPDAARHLVLVGGGSGITPLVAILEHALASEPSTRVTLVYGNRGAADVIFARRLDALAAEAGARLDLRLALSEPPAGWTGAVGPLDRPTLTRLLPDHDATTTYWLCGPEPMMAAARDELAARGVPPTLVHAERFLALGAQATATVALPSAPQALVVRAAGRVFQATVAPGQTLLEAGLAAGAPMPSSCQLGGCGACRVHLRAGEVAYATPNCLTAEELHDGHALACVARPLSAVDLEVAP